MQTITIVGGGTAGWITAAVLAKGLPGDAFEIKLIESPDIPTVGVGEATIPPIIQLLQYLELDEAEFLVQIEGTYKYGIHFENWSQQGESYMHAFGVLGTDYQDIAFSDLWLAYANKLNIKNLTDFIPSAVAAYQNRFCPALPIPDSSNPNAFFPLSNLFYAFQFDAGLLANYLRQYSKKLGVNHIQANVENVQVKAGKQIESVVLDSGIEVKADYFVDCSGARGLLSKQALALEFDNWQAYLPCDSAIAVQTENLADIAPYTKSIAMSSGWRWQIPLRSRMGNGYVYSSQFMNDEQALTELTQALESNIITEPKQLRFETGCLQNPWFNNCIAIGLSSGFLEPLESTSIHLIHKYAVKLKNALLHGVYMQEEAQQFNLAFKQDALDIRDFLVAHYHITERKDSQFWRHCQNMPIPESLQQKLAEFSATGKISLKKEALFSYGSWLQLLVGQGYIKATPGQFDGLLQSANTPSVEQAKLFFDNVKYAISQEVKRIPKHQAYLKLN